LQYPKFPQGSQNTTNEDGKPEEIHSSPLHEVPPASICCQIF